MGFFRREKPLHEKLAEEAGLLLPDDPRAEAEAWRDPPAPVVPPTGTRVYPALDVAGIHGIPRNREWDAVVSAAAPDLPGDRLEFVGLADGTLFTDDDLPDDALTPLADALEGRVDAPYHALAVHQEEDVWAAAAMKVDVVEVPEDVPGDKVEMAVNDDEHTVLVDDAESKERIPSLEQFAAQQFGSFVLRASRLDDVLWEVTVLPL